MKKSLIVVMTVVCLLSMATIASANSGSAVLPAYYFNGVDSTTYSWTGIRISNITSSPINVKVTLYKQDGSLFSPITDYIATINVQNFISNLSDASCTFTLNGNATGIISIRKSPSPETFGYGKIEWNQDSNSIYGLIAFSSFAQFVNGQITSRYSVEINSGKPF